MVAISVIGHYDLKAKKTRLNRSEGVIHDVDVKLYLFV